MMTAEIKGLLIIAEVFVALLVLIIYSYRSGQVRCEKCGWYNQHGWIKPKSCGRCDVKLV